MSEYIISQITEKRIDDTAGMLAEEVVSAIKKGLPATAREHGTGSVLCRGTGKAACGYG